MRLEARWLGRLGYSEGLSLQTSTVDEVRRGARPATLLLLEHSPVVTLGRSADPAHVLVSERELASRGVELHRTGRGGDVTFHGPGQLVGYPILALPQERRDAHRYLRDLEEVLIRTVAVYHVTAGRKPGLTGIWVGDEKLAAIGVRLNTGWITSHGFALNVAANHEGFSLIVPCGIAVHGVTSIEELRGTRPSLRAVAARVARELAAVFGFELTDPDDPGERLAAPA